MLCDDPARRVTCSRDARLAAGPSKSMSVTVTPNSGRTPCCSSQAWMGRITHQSITMDEAMTWRSYVAPIDPNHWTAHSNNHVLNSLLMRLAVAAFGLSELSVRLPALAGACVYIGSCFFLCRLLFEEALARVLVFVCLVLNPYLGDFFAAARGYSLAFGFLVCAIALVADLQLQLPGAPPAKAARVCALVSAVL